MQPVATTGCKASIEKQQTLLFFVQKRKFFFVFCTKIITFAPKTRALMLQLEEIKKLKQLANVPIALSGRWCLSEATA